MYIQTNDQDKITSVFHGDNVESSDWIHISNNSFANAPNETKTRAVELYYNKNNGLTWKTAKKEIQTEEE